MTVGKSTADSSTCIETNSALSRIGSSLKMVVETNWRPVLTRKINAAIRNTQRSGDGCSWFSSMSLALVDFQRNFGIKAFKYQAAILSFFYAKEDPEVVKLGS